MVQWFVFGADKCVNSNPAQALPLAVSTPR
jgi:hypothetical protein